MQVWINGEFIEREEARISVFDAGFQHGVGLFETMHGRNGRIFRVEDHVARLIESAKDLFLSERLRPAPLAEVAELAMKRNELAAARVRLTVTGGDLGAPGAEAAAGRDPTVLVVAQPPTPYPDSFFEKGVVVAIADGRVNPLDPMAGYKTLNYWPRIQALQKTAGSGAGEALWFSVSNHLASGSVCNVFLVKDGDLLTPIARGEEEPGGLRAPVLPGITRRTVIEIAAAEGMATRKRMLDIDDLLGADEVFLTNSSWGVLPVVGVEREPIGERAVGAVTRQIRAAWNERVEDETRR